MQPFVPVEFGLLGIPGDLIPTPYEDGGGIGFIYGNPYENPEPDRQERESDGRFDPDPEDT